MSAPSRSLIATLMAVVVLIAACSTGDATGGDDRADNTRSDDDSSDDNSGDNNSDGASDGEVDPPTIETGSARDFGPAPSVPEGPWTDADIDALDEAVAALAVGTTPFDQFLQLGQADDPRLAWPLADILRFLGPGEASTGVVSALEQLLPDLTVDPFTPWGTTVDHLIAWDVPVPEDQYLEFKRTFYGLIEPKWTEMFTDEANIDWRLVGWGGVGIDDRPFGSTDPCRCIPALDEPPVTGADEGDWYPDDALIFGVVIDGEARAYPKNIMEVHEMVNDTLGGRQIAMPYCTLCGSAQVYLTDEMSTDLVEEFGRPTMRTSGLLIRSNKMMFERESRSFIDTFTGEAVSGPLADAGVVFEQVSVVTSTWADWKEAHPETTILASDGGLGRSYELDPLGGRDDNGPIFPIGDVDPRLAIQEPILGVFTNDGRPLAVHVEAAASLLSGGGDLEIEGLEIRLDGSGIRALRDGQDAGGHQAFWFAWSQFHPDTLVWPLDFPEQADG